ncbi:GNAT family N-acetyltransferase [Roseibium litorale]|uniref:GNAT family N-acetyltransferase n=1 Tax=Roseibium litorale TaxID=2803841 RepID=A0ABR9CH99_9HYPH|nr:GNAT family N-acetyltransferase [Roseibium litorale]MBD8890133.1 GNAT family N-acetyltransferase [Roseibium litorale]
MEEVVIRPLTREDRPQWDVLWQAYLTFYEQTLPQEVTDGLFERLLGEGGHFALVAERAGKLTGLVHSLPHASTWSLAPTCYLEDLFVAPDQRGAGTGRKLIEGVYEEATKRGCTNVYWHTHDDNSTARRLYDRIGVLSKFVRYDKRRWEEPR